jgi:hypothetical protein
MENAYPFVSRCRGRLQEEKDIQQTTEMAAPEFHAHAIIIRSPAAEGHTAPGWFIAFQILFISDSN